MNPFIPLLLISRVSLSTVTLHLVVWMICLTAAVDLATAGPTPPSALNGIAFPPTPGLLAGKSPIIVNKTRAIQLGKALFWDSAVGSDGMAGKTMHMNRFRLGVPVWRASWVIEAEGGAFGRWGLHVGDEVELRRNDADGSAP